MDKLFYLIGGNGAPNFGDELMARAWIDHLSTSFPDSRILLDCNSVRTPELYFRERYPSLEVVAGLKQFCNRTVKDMFGAGKPKSRNFLDALRYGLEFFDGGHADRHPELRQALEAVERSHSFHIFGGGYINTGIRPDSGFLIGIAAAIARRFGTAVFATGIGITPFSLEGADAEPLRAALADFRLFECRDSYGFDKLFAIANGAAPLVNGVDDSFLLRPAATPPATVLTLHVSLLRKPLEAQNAALYDELCAAAERFERVVYWNCVPNLGDQNLTLLRQRLPRMEVLDCFELTHAPLPVHPGDFMVTQRFHPHLVAARLGCAGLFVEDGIYYFDKHHSILHLGSGYRKYQPGGLRVPEASAAPIVAQDPENMARKARVRDACYGAR